MSVNRSQGKDIELGDYLIKNTIGQGTFGKVKLGINRKNNSKVAIKILEASKIIEKDDQERVDRELKIIQDFNHPNVVLVTDIYKSCENFYIVMEYCEGGELFNYIVKKKRLPEDEASFFFYQIINGLEYIHSHNVVHRDLKPENLLLTRDYLLKIIDFGLSNFFHKKLLTTPCGSPCYASPEMVSGKKYNGFRIDIWSTGIILYAMICGYLPFEDKDNEVLFKKILECKLVLPHHVSPVVKDLMLKILVTDHNKRITLKEIKRHPFFLQGKAYFEMKFGDIEEMPGILPLEDEDDYLYQVNKTEGCESNHKRNKNNYKDKVIEKNNNKAKEKEKDKEKKRHQNNIKSEDEKYGTTLQVNTDNIKAAVLKSAKKEERSITHTMPNALTNPTTNSHKPEKQVSDKKHASSKSPKKTLGPTKPKTHLNNPSIRGLNSMRFPLYTTVLNKKTNTLESFPSQSQNQSQTTHENAHQAITNNKPITQKINSITINHAAININMIDPNILLTNPNKMTSNHRTSTSVSVGKKPTAYSSIRKSEKKNQGLKFYDLFKPNTTTTPTPKTIQQSQVTRGGEGGGIEGEGCVSYADSVVKTQENYPLKSKLINSLVKNDHPTTLMSNTNRKRLSSLLHSYQPIHTITGTKPNHSNNKHGKIHSLKLTDFYSFKKSSTINDNTNPNLSLHQKKKDLDKTLAYLRSHFKNLCYKDLVSKLK